MEEGRERHEVVPLPGEMVAEDCGFSIAGRVSGSFHPMAEQHDPRGGEAAAPSAVQFSDIAGIVPRKPV